MKDLNTSPGEALKKQLAKQKREAKRLKRMLGGLDDLESWMTDLLRQGLASMERDGSLETSE